MRKNKLSILATSVCAIALALPMAILGKSIYEMVNKEETETFVDPISYQTPKPISYLTPNEVVTKEDDPVISVKKVTIHYHNDDNACQNRRFYTWVTGVDGVERMPDEASWTATDMQITLDFTTLTEYANMPSIYFIIKVAGTWAGQSEDTELVYEKFETAIVNEELTVWTVPGEGTSIEIYETEAETKLPKITTAKFVDFKTIQCTCTIDESGKAWVPSSYKLYAFDKSYHSSTESTQKAQKEFYLFKQGTPTGNVFNISFNYNAKINVQYMIESVFPGYENKPPRKIVVSCENLYEDERFETYYTYKGNDLGVTYTPTQTTFKVWSPVSAFAQVFIYDRGDPKSLKMGGNDNKKVYNMFYTKGGIWEVTILGDLKGKFYTYSLTHSAGTVETMDPYAKACGINGMRGFIYDKTSADANPDGWDTVPTKWDGVSGYDIKTPQDLSIYEVHIRDLTMDETWVSKKGNKRGTYAAFAESGTTYSQDGQTVTTGYDHIRDLGVKAIQLLPVFDNDNDERPEKMKFNWGYNPLNYNCVDGGYSTDPMNPLNRIKEYKNLIKAYSENGNHTRVIMDVVYNHVSGASSSCFTKCMPKYYFRYTSDWAYYDGSGCSNEVKTDSTMMRKYIIDSLVWWATEYKVKGFRFDLMGLIDTWTLRELKETLYEIDPDIVIYGEGWTSGGYHGKYELNDSGELINGGAETKLVYSQLYASNSSHGQVGGFNDEGRDSLKGKNDDGYAGFPYPTWGFMSSGQGDVGDTSDKVAGMMMGANLRAPGANPEQTLNYASCHDNYTVWDQLRFALANGHDSQTRKPNTEPSVTDLLAATFATHAAIMLSNGVAFMQGGEELYRTKNYQYCSEEEWAELTSKEGAEKKLRPFPDYPHYYPVIGKDDKGNPIYDTSVVIATDDVRMYGNGRDIVSHNSYKSPDSVNSFKWDRKIKIGTTSTYEYNAKWQAMIKARDDMQRASYHDIYELYDHDKFNVWNNSYGSTVLCQWTRLVSDTSKGYAVVFAGRAGGSYTWGGLSVVNEMFSNGKYTRNGETINLQPYGYVCFKVNG